MNQQAEGQLILARLTIARQTTRLFQLEELLAKLLPKIDDEVLRTQIIEVLKK